MQDHLQRSDRDALREDSGTDHDCILHLNKQNRNMGGRVRATGYFTIIPCTILGWGKGPPEVQED